MFQLIRGRGFVSGQGDGAGAMQTSEIPISALEIVVGHSREPLPPQHGSTRRILYPHIATVR